MNLEFSLRPVAERLAELLGRPVEFAEDCIGPQAQAAVERAMAGGKVVLLENLRFHPEEEKNDAAFARQLAALADVYVNDAFGSATARTPRSRRSRKILPHAGGRPPDGEGTQVPRASRSGRPSGRSWRSSAAPRCRTRSRSSRTCCGRVDALPIGGAMAYTFLKSRGIPIGKSLVEDDKLDAARSHHGARGRARSVRLELPVDHVVDRRRSSRARRTRRSRWTTRRSATGWAWTSARRRSRRTQALLGGAKTVVWNGPMGVFEITPFDAGTNAVAQAVASVHGTTIIGGGDSVSAVTKAGVADRITHISTGGGASLEFLGGRRLPGVAALAEK